MPAGAQVIPETMHEWTSTAGSPVALTEAFADTKTPGKGLTYSVGAIDVEQTQFNPTFSTFLSTGLPAGVSNPVGIPAVPLVMAPKQVVILQCVDSVGEIQWQRYFFGVTNVLGARRATNARAISVWEAEDPVDARIAVCGETYEDILPQSQDLGGFVQNPLLANQDPTGFIAVYNGAGDLLWTHHFFGVALQNPLGLQNQPDCAITDVSIRVEGEGENRRDVVTYCGISSYGNPATGNAWLDPILPFESIATATGSGDTDFGVYQWDGVVGRLSRPHVAPYDPQFPLQGLQREFHSIVGGPEQDGLFGIAEMADDRFLTVGSSQRNTGGGTGFPFGTTAPAGIVTVPTLAFPYAVGTVLGFDAAPTRQMPQGRLQLENGLPLGSFGGGAISHATDVVVQSRNWAGNYNAVFVVGTTNDPAFLASFPGLLTTPSSLVLPGSDVLQGASDGFVLTANDVPLGNILYLGFFGGVFVGGAGADGLTGVGGWNEHTDHAQVCGYSVEAGSMQVQVASFMAGTATLTAMRRSVFGGVGSDRPAVMGTTNATTGVSGIAYSTGLPLTDPAGGGIGVDERGRLTVVGACDSPTLYPVVPVFFGRAYRGGWDAVRTEFDMLPVGVARTDGTGSRMSGAPPAWPPAGTNGGTTPACLLTPSPYGLRVGEPVPLLQRMLIDFEGGNVPGVTPAIWTTRPSDIGQIIVGALQVGLPTMSPVYLDLAEIWVLNNPVLVTELWASNNPYRAWRIPFIPLPAAPASFSVQVACLVVPFNPVTSTGATPCGTSTITTLASPALFFEY